MLITNNKIQLTVEYWRVNWIALSSGDMLDVLLITWVDSTWLIGWMAANLRMQLPSKLILCNLSRLL